MAAHGTATGRESRSVMSTLGRTIASVALVSAALSISGSPHTLAADASPTGSVDVSGITIVGPGTIQARATSDTQALAFDAALSLALKYPDDFGYPWIDPNTNTLELSTVNAAGASRAEDVETRSPIADEQSRNTIAGASISKLMAITDEVTALGDEFPNDHLIWMIEPDQQHNRIVISISQRNEDLLKGLADKFGTELIEVRVAEAKLAGTMNRNSDNPSFWGGAKIFVPGNATCTTGFAWKDGTQFAMLTAAHCASTGGNISYLNYPNAGSVRGGYEENWLAGTGTVYYQGQSVYRGDVALIRYTSYGSGPYIYSGGPGTSSDRAVAQMNPTRAQVGAAACVNGYITGEWCGAVYGGGLTVRYIVDGWNTWARNVVEVDALGNTCPTHGDSGAPVYHKRSDGKVIAYGIFSGSGPLIAACSVWMTDIWDAWYGLHGTLQVTG